MKCAHGRRSKILQGWDLEMLGFFANDRCFDLLHGDWNEKQSIKIDESRVYIKPQAYRGNIEFSEQLSVLRISGGDRKSLDLVVEGVIAAKCHLTVLKIDDWVSSPFLRALWRRRPSSVFSNPVEVHFHEIYGSGLLVLRNLIRNYSVKRVHLRSGLPPLALLEECKDAKFQMLETSWNPFEPRETYAVLRAMCNTPKKRIRDIDTEKLMHVSNRLAKKLYSWLHRNMTFDDFEFVTEYAFTDPIFALILNDANYFLKG